MCWVLRRIFGLNRDEVTREWREVHNEELKDLYCSPNIVRVTKSRMRWAGNVACMGRGEACTWLWWGYLRERGHLVDPGVVGSVILRWFFRSCRKGSQTQQCILTYISVELLFSAYIEAIIRFNIAS